MKYTSKSLFIVGMLLLSGLSGKASSLSLKMNNVPLKEVLESVRKQTGLALWYKQDDLNVNQKISVNETNIPLEDLLAQILSDQPVEFEIKDQYINIFRTNQENAPKRKISGQVFDETGEPLPGASVIIKGTTDGTITDLDGNFHIDAAEGQQLVVSYVSYLPQDITIGASNKYSIKLKPDVKNIQEVVVTALGVKKNTRALSYSSQKIDSKELTKVKSGNFTNSISGKVSNANILQASGGAGSPTKIILRGNNSLNGTGQPLIVIDGMPVTNYNPRTSTDQGAFGGATLGSDGLSAINADDIEDINILKGPSAAALYGNSAANGAIIITTKSGQAGTAKIQVSSNTTFDHAAYKPNFQTVYGASPDNPYEESWGEKSANASRNKDAYSDFLQTGVNTVNSINFTAGNDLAKIFASYSNTFTKGLIPENKMDRHNLNVRGNANFFKKFLEMDVKLIYTQQQVDNPFSPGLYSNPIVSFLKMPGDFQLNNYRTYQITGSAPYIDNPDPLMNYQNWPVQPRDVYENPYWIVNRERNNNDRSRLMASMNLQFNFTEWLNLQLRGTLDNSDDVLETKFYQGTNTTLSKSNGNYVRSESNAIQYYGDALLNFNKDFDKNIRINALLGTSIKDYKQEGITLSGNRGALFQPNYFNVSNLDFNNGAFTQMIYDRTQLQSLFYSLEVSWKNALFLNHTGRNDWASTLPKDKNSYFFPSIGLSAVISEFLPINKETVNMLKVRGSYTQVGSELPAFIIKPVNTLSSTGGFVRPANIVRPGETLKPELTSSWEIGADVTLLNNLFRADITYYHTNTTNQLFTITAPASSGYAGYYVNGGDIENRGFEASITANPQFGGINWSSTLNFSRNINKVKKLHTSAPEFIISQDDKKRFISMVKEGGSLGDMYAYKLARDEAGKLILGNTYIEEEVVDYEPQEGKLEYVGNANPKFMMSWNNTFTWKNLSFSFLLDGRFGGKVISLTQATLDYAGNSKESADMRAAGGFDMGNGKRYNSMDYYHLIGGKSGLWGEYAYDATNIRLREMIVSWNLPSKWFKSTPVEGIQLSFFGRNLFYLYKPAPVDSEVTSFTDNLLQGVETLALPATRSLGFGVVFNF